VYAKVRRAMAGMACHMRVHECGKMRVRVVNGIVENEICCQEGGIRRKARKLRYSRYVATGLRWGAQMHECAKTMAGGRQNGGVVWKSGAGRCGSEGGKVGVVSLLKQAGPCPVRYHGTRFTVQR